MRETVEETGSGFMDSTFQTLSPLSPPLSRGWAVRNQIKKPRKFPTGWTTKNVLASDCLCSKK